MSKQHTSRFCDKERSAKHQNRPESRSDERSEERQSRMNGSEELQPLEPRDFYVSPFEFGFREYLRAIRKRNRLDEHGDSERKKDTGGKRKRKGSANKKHKSLGVFSIHHAHIHVHGDPSPVPHCELRTKQSAHAAFCL